MALLAGAAWAAAWLGTGGTRGGWVGLGVLALVGATVAVRGRAALAFALVVVVVGVGLAGTGRAVMLADGPVGRLGAEQAYAAGVVQIRGDARLTAPSGPKPGYASVPVTVLSVDGRGAGWRLRAPALLVVTGDGLAGWSGLPVGTRVAVAGRWQPADPGSGLAGLLRVRGGPRTVSPPSAGLALVERVRAGLRASVAHRRPEPRALVPALVLGDTSRLTPALTADFQTTGLTHLTAVSGANLTLLLAFMLLAARGLGVRGRWLRGVGLLGVIAFVALCRTDPSVLRAAAMGLVALAALGAGGRRAGLRNLSVAMTILLLADPFLARSLGFVLSVLASAGIVGWARPWAGLLGRWLPAVVAEAVTVPLAAHLATLPVVAAISGQVSVSGLVTNAVAGPFVGPATVLGFAAAGLSLLGPPLAAVPGFGAAWAAQVIVWVAHAGAALPGSARPWPATPAALAFLAVASATAGVVMGAVLARRWLALLLVGVMMVALALPPVRPGWPPAGWALVACDVGQGDGLVVAAGRGDAIVVDTGPDPVIMGRCLDALGVRRVPLLVLTHFHADHVGGLVGVLRSHPVGGAMGQPVR